MLLLTLSLAALFLFLWLWFQGAELVLWFQGAEPVRLRWMLVEPLAGVCVCGGAAVEAASAPLICCETTPSEI